MCSFLSSVFYNYGFFDILSENYSNYNFCVFLKHSDTKTGVFCTKMQESIIIQSYISCEIDKQNKCINIDYDCTTFDNLISEIENNYFLSLKLIFSLNKILLI